MAFCQTTPIQIIGDSFARRFSIFIESQTADRKGWCAIHTLGLSGATIADVKAAVKFNPPPLQVSVPLLLFVGTNDILKGSNWPNIKNQFLALLRLLKRTYPGINIIICQLPFYPRVRSNFAAHILIANTNQLFLSCQASDTLVLRLGDCFRNPRLFHGFYPHSYKPGGIHFNDLAHFKLLPSLANCCKQFTME